MTTQIINSIKSGAPFSYKSGYPVKSKRVWTISANGRGNFILTANDLKSKTLLTESQVIEIVMNNEN